MHSDPGWIHHPMKHLRWLIIPVHHPYTDHEWDNLPDVTLKSELEWDPAISPGS
jgi:hypothetical protein